MLAWVLEVLQVFIGVLQGWQAQGAMGEVAALSAFVGSIMVPTGGFFLLVRQRARKRYRKGLDELDEARSDLATKEESIRTLQTEKRQKDTQIALLQQMAPEDFTRAMDAHRRDHNTELGVRDAQAYVDFHRPALRRAFGVLTNDLIGHAATEGPATYAIALSHAQAALALTPDDEDLRELAAELAEAATIAPHAAVKLPTAEGRAERLAQRATLPDDLQALQSPYFASNSKGQFHVSLTLARHALRNARRAYGAASEPHVP